MNRPPFVPAVALAARQSLGMSPQQVAEQMNACGASIDISHVHAWEFGDYHPTEQELFALADVLWCRTTDLMGIDDPRTLMEHRLERQFTTARLAHSIGMDTAQYEQAEERSLWTGDAQQTAALLRLLNVSPLQLAQMIYQPGRSWSDASAPPEPSSSRFA
ncbi:helix-turn-helix domain-containing protein [Streptomyces sp. NPDC101237]|uniref:helix-turn-helix domain-containing protein n=1 Tax=Streptomyces sp. NPDC101237 TaxID=3366139 RepID=UPI0038194047